MSLGVDELQQAAEGLGTPLYVYELDEVRARAAELRGALPEGSTLYYSLKANPLVALCAELRAAGCRAEVSSLGELAVAAGAGWAPDDILYTGPGKTLAELEEAVRLGVAVSCESENELERLGGLGRAAGRDVPVLIRLQPEAAARASLSMADERQFGFQVDDAVAALQRAGPGVAVRGFHVYLGSQVQSVVNLAEGFAIAAAAVAATASRAGIQPEVADLGGGFPWPFAAAGRGCELAPLRADLDDLLVPWLVEPAGLQFESGRRLTASAGRLLTRVVDRKTRSGETVIVVDAGINVLGGMAGLGRVLRSKYTFENLSREPDGGGPPVRVVGPLCTPLDRLAAGDGLAGAQIGDLLSVPNAGAYALTASLTAFLSRPAPVEAVFDGGALVGAWRLRSDHERLPAPL